MVEEENINEYKEEQEKNIGNERKQKWNSETKKPTNKWNLEYDRKKKLLVWVWIIFVVLWFILISLSLIKKVLLFLLWIIIFLFGGFLQYWNIILGILLIVFWISFFSWVNFIVKSIDNIINWTSKDCNTKFIYMKIIWIIILSFGTLVINYFLLQWQDNNLIYYYFIFSVLIFVIIFVMDLNSSKLASTADFLVRKLNYYWYIVKFNDSDYGKYKVDDSSGTNKKEWLSFHDLCNERINIKESKKDIWKNKFIINYLNLIKNKLIDYKLYFQFNAIFILWFKLLLVFLILVYLFFLKFSWKVELFDIIFILIITVIYISWVNVFYMARYLPFFVLIYSFLILFQIIFSIVVWHQIIGEKINYLDLEISQLNISKSNTWNNYDTTIVWWLGVSTDFKWNLTFNQVKDLLNSNFVLSNFIVFNIFYYSIVLLFISWFFIILKDISRYNKNFIMLWDKLTKIKILEENIENRLKNGRFIWKYLLNEEKILKEELDKLWLTMRELLPEVGDIHLDDELYKKMLENYKINFKS